MYHITDAFSSRLCICETKPRTMLLTKTNEKFPTAIFNNAHNIWERVRLRQSSMHTTPDFFNGKDCTYEWLIQLKILHLRNHTSHSAIKSYLWALDIFDIRQRTRYYIVKLFPVFRNHQRTCITYTKEHIDNILVLSLILFRGTVAELARRAIG